MDLQSGLLFLKYNKLERKSKKRLVIVSIVKPRNSSKQKTCILFTEKQMCSFGESNIERDGVVNTQRATSDVNESMHWVWNSCGWDAKMNVICLKAYANEHRRFDIKNTICAMHNHHFISLTITTKQLPSSRIFQVYIAPLSPSFPPGEQKQTYKREFTFP